MVLATRKQNVHDFYDLRGDFRDFDVLGTPFSLFWRSGAGFS